MFEAVERTKAQNEGRIFDALSTLYNIVKKNCLPGAKHGRSQEQCDHFEANESTRRAKKKGFDSITLGFQNDQLYRNSQLAIGWTQEHCQCLDSLRGKSVSKR